MRVRPSISMLTTPGGISMMVVMGLATNGAEDGEAAYGDDNDDSGCDERGAVVTTPPRRKV